VQPTAPKLELTTQKEWALILWKPSDKFQRV